MKKLHKIFLIIILILIFFITFTVIYFKINKYPILPDSPIENSSNQALSPSYKQTTETKFFNVSGNNIIVMSDGISREYPIIENVNLYCLGNRISGLEASEIIEIPADKIISKDEIANIIMRDETVTILARITNESPEGEVCGIIYNCE